MPDLPEEVEIAVIPLEYGVAFKKAFHHVDVFCAFVKDVVGIDLKIDTVLQEHQYPKQFGNIDIRHGLFAEDTENRVIVEIQHVQEAYFYDRFLYYHMAGIMEQVTKAERYQPAREVYTIVVLTSTARKPSVKCGVARVRLNPIADDAEEPHAAASSKPQKSTLACKKKRD